jgi:phosphohistidine phosphatase SixA
MNKNTKIFLVRHADYSGSGPDPVLSDYGKRQSLELANKIKTSLNGDVGSVVIWTSSANRANETAQIIKQEMQLAEMLVEEKLWSDNRHSHDFNWLKEKLDGFEGDNLIIVSHLEYVREFPSIVGFPKNYAGYAEGVMIHDNKCINI